MSSWLGTAFEHMLERSLGRHVHAGETRDPHVAIQGWAV